VKNQSIPDKVENILVVRQHNQVGDMLCSTYLYVALKKKFLNANITLVAAQTNYPIPFKDLNPYIDNILMFDISTLKKMFWFFRELRKRKYQIGIVPSTYAISRTSHIINFLSGAKIRIGVSSIGSKSNTYKFLLNVKSDFKWDDNKVHQMDRNLDVVRQIGCDLTADEKHQKGILLTAEDDNFAKLFLRNNLKSEYNILIGFHPGAGKKANIWDTQHWCSLIELLYKRFKNEIIITAGSIDSDLIQKLKEQLQNKNIRYSLVEDLPVKKLAALLKLMDLYVTGDTGPMHVAGFVNTKIVSLFGPTYAYEWAPTGENKISIQSKSKNINDVTVEEVYKNCCSLLYKESG
jgi:ADP-heptose:LPS heptosyltransferase